jgi:hypothetical protein
VAARFSEDGQTLVTTGEAGDVKVWSVGDTTRLRYALSHSPRVPFSEYAVLGQSMINREGDLVTSVVTASDEHPRIRMWSLQPGMLHNVLRAATNACLGLAYRRRLLPSELPKAAEAANAQCEARARARRPSRERPATAAAASPPSS